MAANVYYTKLESVFSTLHAQGIQTKKELDAPEHKALCQDLWLAARNFINYCALASKNHKGNTGNAGRLRALTERGMALDDIRGEILVHVMSKLERVLAQPLEKQVNYVYHMVNNCVFDQMRKQPPAGTMVIHWEDKVGSGEAAEEKTTVQDQIADSLILEDEVAAKETVAERYQAKQREIIKELTHLAERPAEALAWLCTRYLDMKPAAVAKMLLQNHIASVYASVLKNIAQRYQMQPAAIYQCLAGSAITEAALKVDTQNETKVSAQVSRLVYRADRRLRRY